MFDWVVMVGIGIGKMVSYGNKFDVDDVDFMEYFIYDDEIKVVIFYIEGVKDGRKFMEVVKKIIKVKFVIVLKSGRMEYGVKVVFFYIGLFVGVDIIYDVVFK